MELNHVWSITPLPPRPNPDYQLILKQKISNYKMGLFEWLNIFYHFFLKSNFEIFALYYLLCLKPFVIYFYTNGKLFQVKILFTYCRNK
jgi:hypothetical protein